MLLALLQSGIETGTRTSLRLLDLPELWIVVLVLLPLLGIVAWIGYARERIGTGPRLLLSGLRVLALLLLLIVLFRPVVVQRNDEVKPAEVLVLVDDSASMLREDSYASNAELRTALQRFSDVPVERTARMELARQAVDKELLPILARGEYRVHGYRFSRDLTAATEPLEMTGRGHSTHIGEAIERALALHRGEHVTDIVLISDGRSNGGPPALDAARAAGALGVPVHTLVVGDTNPERNLWIELVEAPTDVLEGDEIAVTARVSARGFANEDESASRVMLEELSAGGDRLLAEEPIVPNADGTRVVLVAPPGSSTQGGDRRFRISVEPVAGESLLDDNSVEFRVHLTPEKVRVLYVDAYPRWEYRFLKELLKRSDQNIEASIFLLSAEASFVQESSRGVEPLTEVPTDRKQLLENYDVIILGDVNPYAISPDPARCEEFLTSLREFVERGGGLFMQAGQYDNPRSYVDTELEELLPVLLDKTGALAFTGDTTVEKHPLLETPNAPHQIVRLNPDSEVNRQLWEEQGGLSGFYWYAPVTRAKPGAQVLLRHPFEESAYGRHPLLVAGYFPAGRTLFFALDSTWRWRFRFGDYYHERFWRDAIRWLALGRLKSGDRRTRLDSLRSSYSLEERVVLEARVLDEDFHPSERPVQNGRIEGPDGEITELSLVLVPDRAGLYRAALEVGRPGVYRAWLEDEGRRTASCEFEVSLPSRENADPTPDPALLASISSLTGGRALHLAKLTDLSNEFPGNEERREPISSQLDDAWDNWWTLILALLFLSAEWIARKKWEMV